MELDHFQSVFFLNSTALLSIQLLALFVEANSLSSEKSFLQSPSNFQTHQTQLQLQWLWCVVYNRSNELISLRCKSIFESFPILGLNLVADANSLGNRDIVESWDQVDHDFPLCAYHLGAHIMAVNLSSRAVEVCDLPSPVFNNTDSIINIIQVFQLWMVSNGSDSPGCLGNHMPKVVQRQIDIMEAVVHEHTSILLGVPQEKSCVIDEVVCLRPNHNGSLIASLVI